MTAVAITRPQTNASTAAPLVFFIHATDPAGRDIMPGPFAASCANQDKAATEARAALAGTGYQPRAILFNVAILPSELIPWNEGEGLRLFGIEQESRP
ncbi:hypothetical protein [Zobellella maritima]|uniref:hypothetical protein n=1 Tax=Zobellella maritima TaxID=2059725 RepID=UPI000E3033B8|nr:hypothetical protein [Zobellella maritima]